MFPDALKPDTASFKAGYLVKFQLHLIELDYAETQVKRLFHIVKRVLEWAGEPRFDTETWDTLAPIISSQQTPK